MTEDEQHFEMAKEVAEQFWREQQLTSSRMTWNLTFQSFLVAAFVLTFGQEVNYGISLVLRLTICAAGFAVAFVTVFSVRASQEQRDYLRTIWYDLYSVPRFFTYPRPFAAPQHSQLARRLPARILFTLMGMWGVFFVLAIVAASSRDHGGWWLKIGFGSN